MPLKGINDVSFSFPKEPCNNPGNVLVLPGIERLSKLADGEMRTDEA